jgi:hypothetical protein
LLTSQVIAEVTELRSAAKHMTQEALSPFP